MSSDPNRPKRPFKQSFRSRIMGESSVVAATGDEQSKEIQDPIKITKRNSEFRVENVATMVRFISSDDHWNPKKKKRMAPENSPSAEIAETKSEGLIVVIPMDREKNPEKTAGEVEAGLPAVVAEEQLKTESTPESYKERSPNFLASWKDLGSRRSRDRGDHQNRSETKSQKIRASMKEVRAPTEVSQPIPPALETRRSMRSRKRNQASKREERFLFSLTQNQIEADFLVMNQLVEDLHVSARSKDAQKSLDKAFPGLSLPKVITIEKYLGSGTLEVSPCRMVFSHRHCKM